MHGERVFIIDSYISYPELMSVMGTGDRDYLDMRVKYCIFIARVYLKQRLQRVDITDDDLVHEGDQEVLELDIYLQDFVLELDLADELLGVEIEGSHLETCELLSSFLSLVKHVKLRLLSYHEEHVIELLHEFDTFLNVLKSDKIPLKASSLRGSCLLLSEYLEFPNLWIPEMRALL